MASKDEREFDSGLTGGTDVPALEEDFSLEEILAEYGAGREQRLMEAVEQEARRETEPAAPPAEGGAKKPPLQTEARPRPAPQVTEKTAPPQKPPAQPEDLLEELRQDLPPSPHPITLEDVVGSTVDAVMEEEAQEPLLRPRRGLFSRKRLMETEELYAPPEPEEAPEEIPEIDTIGPEPELAEAAADYRAEAKRRKHPILAAVLISLLPVIPMGIEAYGYEIRYWTGDAAVQSGVLLACLAAVAVLARQVFAKAFGSLLQKRCTSELLAVVSAVVMAADCVARLVLPERSAVPCYAPVGCLALVFAMWGGARESRGLWDTFRMAATDDEPPYLVTETEKGACKQAGSVPGFYTTALREDTAAVWQNAGGADGLHRVCRAQLPGPGTGGRLFAELVCHPGGRHHLCPASVLGDALLPAGPALSQGGVRRGGLVRCGEDQPQAGHDPDGRRPVPAGYDPAQRRKGVRGGPVPGFLLCRLYGPGGGLRPSAVV